MFTYYHTSTRIFSLLFGVSLGFIHHYYKSLIPKFKKEYPNKIIFSIYLIILIILFIFISANSKYFGICMILTTLITCRMLDYKKGNENKNFKLLKFIAKITYPIYLVQYPIIFFFQQLNLDGLIETPIIIVSTILVAILLYIGCNFNNKDKKFKIIRYFLNIFTILISIYGAYQYIIAKDYTKEMNELEKQLNQNELLMTAKQEEYQAAFQEADTLWQTTLQDLENAEIELKENIANMSVVGVGDSVMLGAIDNLYEQFPNGYFDAKISRTAWVVGDILQNLKNKNMLGDPIILNLGANGDCPEECKQKIIKICEDREIFWLTVTNDNDVHFNAKITAFASQYENVHIIDWASISKDHPEYFVADQIHLTENGKIAYTNAVYEGIYQVYLEKYNNEKEEIIKKHEEDQKNKITFYSNDILLNSYDYLQTEFPDAYFYLDNNYNFETLKNELEEKANTNTLTNKIVFAFDSRISLTLKEYQELIDILKNTQVYILSTNSNTNAISSHFTDESITFINFYQEILKHDNYLLIDQIHLTNEGNKALQELLVSILKETN